VSCASPTACTAIGSYVDPTELGGGLLVERWNGRHWSLVRPPKDVSRFRGVSCPTARVCTVVGSDAQQTPLAARWSGASWVIQRLPLPTGATGSVLSGVSCTSRRACTAVGSVNETAAAGLVVRTLVERWNGKRWSVQPAPTPTVCQQGHCYTIGGFLGVSCASATVCTAVGTYRVPADQQRVLVERWDGKRWTIQPSPTPQRRPSALTLVSCPSVTACMTVRSSGGGELFEHWVGKRWTVYPGGTTANLTGLSCPTTSACTAVGSLPGRGGLVERWNGKDWSDQPTANPGNLGGVSCTSATVCTAVGSSYNSADGIAAPLAERWKGHR
jgi:hypothetical protein